jgi:hypothetical protein
VNTPVYVLLRYKLPSETGPPCYRLQIRNVQGYNEQVVGSDSVYNANHEYRRLRLKNGENCPEYGKWYTINSWGKVFIYRLSREIFVTRQDFDKMKLNVEMFNSYLAQLNEMIQSAKRKLHDLKKEPNTSWTNYPRASLFDVNPTSQSSDTVDRKSRNYKGVEDRPFFGS